MISGLTLWALGISAGVLSIAASARTVVSKMVADHLGIPEASQAAGEALRDLAEAKRELVQVANASGKLIQERAQLETALSGFLDDISAPKRERIDLVFELGAPRGDGAHVDFMARCIMGGTRTPDTGRVPDSDVWRRPKLVRVWGQNAQLCGSMAQQRFGSKRLFTLEPIDDTGGKAKPLE
jgi:hypothetical protein